MKNNFFLTLLLCVPIFSYAQNKGNKVQPFSEMGIIPEANITVDVANTKAEISPTMYGIFFEDINRSADGGMYAELIFNRGFEEMNLPSGCRYDAETKRVYAPYKPVYSSPEQLRSWSIPWNIDDTHPGWTVETDQDAVYNLKLADTTPQHVEGSKSMYIDISKFTNTFCLVNSGFYGLAVEKGKKYDLAFYLQAKENFVGDINAEIRNSDKTVIASHPIKIKNDGKWHKYECTLIPLQTINDGTFALNFGSTGNIAVDYVSLFPQETFCNHKNGLRKDVAQFVADLKPAFVRWPGGCIVEGLTMENRVKWKNTIGDPATRPGEYNLWGYHSTQGFGYHEFLQYCEDIDAQAMFVCNAGMSCDGRNGDFYEEDELEALIQDALDAIEYAVGDTNTKWGKERAKNGHAEPFKLNYIEVGNENHSAMYAKYYNKFYDRIRAVYPNITIITCLPVSDQLNNLKGFDMNDPHFYNFPVWFYNNTDYFDKIPRKEYTTYVGEYACNMGVGSGNMDGALSEGAFMIGMERNADLVKMTSYAPLIENTKCRMGVNLILVKNDDVIGRSSYYVERMFTDNRPDVNLATEMKLGLLPDKTSPVGGIGFGTYKTSASYSNLKIKVDNKVVYECTEMNPKEWDFISGNWEVKDGKLVQPDKDGIFTAMLKSHYYNSKNMSIEFDAVKKEGEEGFVLLFGAKDYQNCYQMTLGSYGNRWTIFQTNEKGNVFVLNEDRPDFPIQKGKKYHVEVVIKGNMLECRVDGKLNLSYDNTYIQRQYAIAGLDRKKKEVIVKVINAESVPMKTTLFFKNAKFKSEGTITTLAAKSKFEENTFDDPNRIMPVTETLKGIKETVKITFKPYSMTVLRLKLEK